VWDKQASLETGHKWGLCWKIMCKKIKVKTKIQRSLSVQMHILTYDFLFCG
jgi:hypothetical protein